MFHAYSKHAMATPPCTSTTSPGTISSTSVISISSSTSLPSSVTTASPFLPSTRSTLAGKASSEQVMQCPSGSSSQLFIVITLHVQNRYAPTPTGHDTVSHASPVSPVGQLPERQNKSLPLSDSTGHHRRQQAPA